jgi:predicted amidohydrolase YtcJ
MDPARPRAEAVAVAQGRIVAVGGRAELEASRKGPATRVVDIGGATLLPGFIDGHSHISQALTFADWANVSIPPVGSVDSIASLLETLGRHLATRGGAAPGEWILAWGYDPDGLAEKRHVVRADLDAAFPDNPVMLLHVSGHGVVLNSAALRLAGIDARTPTPAGGVIARLPGSDEPAGLLMESAALLAYAAIPRPMGLPTTRPWSCSAVPPPRVRYGSTWWRCPWCSSPPSSTRACASASAATRGT